MVVASFYPAEEDSESAMVPVSKRERLRSFVLSVAPLVEGYYVFTSNGVNHRQLLPDCLPNVHIANAGVLFENNFRRAIDIWHDFGYGNCRTFDQVRHLTRQNFHITGDFRIERFAHYSDTGDADWSAYDGVIYPTDYAREAHRRSAVVLPPVMSEVIPPSMDFDLVAPVTKADARRLLGFFQNEILFLCVSDFSARYGSDLLPIVTAFESAASGRQDLRLVIGGQDLSGISPKLKDGLLNKAILSQITVLANPHEQIFPLLFAAADVFIHLPDSPNKDSSTMLLYAMAHGLAIIGARWPACESMVDHLQSGLLLPMYSNSGIFEYLGETLHRESNEACSLIVSQGILFDVQTLAKNMRTLADGSHRQTLGAAASDKVRNHYQAPNAARAYVEFWNALKKRPIKGNRTSELKGTNGYERKTLHFSYPFAELNGDRCLCVTKLGDAALSGKSVPIFDETSELIFNPLILEIMKRFKNGARMGDVLDALVPTNGEASQRALHSGILYHTLFALKRGLLSQNCPK